MTTTRRSFLAGSTGALSGLMFCGCGMLHARKAYAQGTPPAPAVRRAKPRVKVIDTHAHCFFQDAIDLMGPDAKRVLPPVKGIPEHFIPTQLDARLKMMDGQGVDMQVLSINPFWYRKDVDTARAICSIHNQKLGELCAEKPDRFAAFASLPLQNPQIATQMLEEAVRKYRLRGAAIGGSFNGKDFAHPDFHPIWAKAEELGAVLFIHPQSTPQLAERFKGNGWLSNVIGNPLDTTIALEHLVFEGTLDKFPGLKILAAHGGGYFPLAAVRSDRSCYVSPTSCNPNVVLKKKPSEYLRQIHYDSIVITPEALRNLVRQVGPGQVMVGTDSPIPWNEQPVDHVMATDLTEAEKIAVLGGNAARLFGINA